MKHKAIRTILLLALLATFGCASGPQFVSEQTVEEKLARLTLGRTTMQDIETTFGAPNLREKRLWVYNLADTAVDFSELRSPIMSGLIPPMPFNVPTNTRALISLWFNDSGKIKGLEVSRYFSAPYTHDYWYLIKESSENPLESIARMGELSGFKVSGLEKSKRTFKLENASSKAQIAVTLDNQTLHIISTNPYDRLSNEYRVFVKGETAFIDGVSKSESLE
jgi:hypothetical protein